MQKNNYSLLREKEYRELSKLKLVGRILDLGGSKKSGYQELIKGNHKITTVNIDPSFQCDLVFDIEKKFPLEDGQFNNVICFNVLEHIFNFQNVFSEISRVLNSGGLFVFATPFIFQIHGSPDDYFRYTKSCIGKLLKENDFVIIEIKELGAGIFSLFFQIIGGVIPTMFLKVATKNFCVYIDLVLGRISKRYKEFSKKVPLGYYVVAQKK